MGVGVIGDDVGVKTGGCVTVGAGACVGKDVDVAIGDGVMVATGVGVGNEIGVGICVATGLAVGAAVGSAGTGVSVAAGVASCSAESAPHSPRLVSEPMPLTARSSMYISKVPVKPLNLMTITSRGSLLGSA
jgi:hypothetical protein